MSQGRVKDNPGFRQTATGSVDAHIPSYNGLPGETEAALRGRNDAEG